MSDSAADGVIETAIKSCIHEHPKHLYQRHLRPPKLKNIVIEERTDLFHQYSLSLLEKFIGSVADSSEEFIAGVNNTNSNIFPQFRHKQHLRKTFQQCQRRRR